jgi:hypothetical protein
MACLVESIQPARHIRLGLVLANLGRPGFMLDLGGVLGVQGREQGA